jgi:hypothetical protein
VKNMTSLRLKLGTGADRDARLFGEIVSVYYGLDKLKIVTPKLTEECNNNPYDVALGFISNILPMIRDGHIKEARHEAPSILTAMGGIASEQKEPLYKRIWPFTLTFDPPAAA